MIITDIRSIHFVADDKLHDYIQDNVQKLDKYYPKIIDMAITLKLENSGQVKDKICELKCRIPGQLIVVEGISKNFEEACDDATRTLKRQLIKLKEKMIQR